MRLLVLVLAILSFAACNSGGGGGDGGGSTFGNGKVVTTPLTDKQKSDFFSLFISVSRAQSAYMRVGYPKDKSNDPIETKMYDTLVAAGCTMIKTSKKNGDTSIVDESISNTGCPINYSEHKEVSETKQIASQKYLALTPVYKEMNDVTGLTMDTEVRIAGRNASFEGTGKILSNIYIELPYYSFGTFQWSEDGKNGKIRAGIGVHMPFGIVQITTTTSSENGKTTTEVEINGEKLDTSTSPDLNFINQLTFTQDLCKAKISPLDEEFKAEFVVYLSAYFRALQAIAILEQPTRKTNDQTIQKMVAMLNATGCKYDSKISKENDIYVYDDKIIGENCAIAYNQNFVADSKSGGDGTRDYVVQNKTYGMLNEVLRIEDKSSHRQSQKGDVYESSGWTRGSVYTDKYSILETCGLIDSHFESRNGTTTFFMNTAMPFGTAQFKIILNITGQDRKFTYEINGEQIDPNSLPIANPDLFLNNFKKKNLTP